jgi:parallel beta-helix repeat protein
MRALRSASLLALLGLTVSAAGAQRLAQPGQAAPCLDAAACQRTRRFVSTEADLRSAIAAAHAGDVITLLPGRYRFDRTLAARAEGTEQAPIVVKAERPGSVDIEFTTVEGFAVTGPWWRFENLAIRGACTNDGDCEHAFHVSGAAHHFSALNNTVRDFNAQFKINGADGRFPDNGLIDHNTLVNSAPRQTASPVTPIDLVAASGWTIRGNLIADFVKAQGDRISYGAFAKGAGAGTTFEDNVVLCEQRLQGEPGQRVGLSLGGGGTGKPYCRDHRCITEHDHGIIRDNLVASCSDAGIYVNSSADTRIVHNTLLDTGGIDVRFPESAAEVTGNLVDGTIRARDGARIRALDNLDTPIAYLYAGYHPVRKLFAGVQGLDLGWAAQPPKRALASASTDMCGRRRPVWARYGAFEDFAACLR